MLWLPLTLIAVSSALALKPANSKQYYDTFHGTKLTSEQLREMVKRNTTHWCAIEIKKCDRHEGRRLDGSCNNLQHPTRGAKHTPSLRVLPAVYGKNFEPRLSKSGASLPLARKVRTTLLSAGRVPDVKFTQLVTYLFLFMASDVASVHDSVNYALWKTYCCEPRGKNDPMCTPNMIPRDDPVHRFSGITCLNMTRPMSYQSTGCLPKNTTPERINSATPVFDLSTMYGSDLKSSLERGRLFRGGLLKFEEENGRIWPPSTKTQANICLANQKPKETRCHKAPDDGVNTIAGTNLFSIWLWRNHNRIATELGKINPCWNDERLFYTARDINIASVSQMFYYEMMPALLGRENLLRDGIISDSPGYRDIYDPTVIPQASLEYPYALRWVHNMQEGVVKMYDTEGNYLKRYPIVNLTLKTGFYAVDDNIDYITQGAFRQPCAKSDFVVDPDMAELALGPHQRTSDVFTSDLAKGRYFGFPPYVEYLKFCFGKTYSSFDELIDYIDPEQIERLKEAYESVEDIELMAGMWVERWIPGGYVPATFYCLNVDQLARSMVSDRHFYESSVRPNAFTHEQLLEIRKATIARFMCDVGDKVTRIQRHAFLKPDSNNKMMNCDLIPSINLDAWKDYICDCNIESCYK